MFRQLAKEAAKRPPVTGSPAPGPMDIFQYHPAQLAALLEAVALFEKVCTFESGPQNEPDRRAC